MWLIKGIIATTFIFVSAFLLSFLSEITIMVIVFLVLTAIFSWWAYMGGKK